MQGSICQEYQLSSVSVPITYLRTGKMTAAWVHGPRGPFWTTRLVHFRNDQRIEWGPAVAPRSTAWWKGLWFVSSPQEGRLMRSLRGLLLTCVQKQSWQGQGWTVVAMKMPVHLSTVGEQLTDTPLRGPNPPLHSRQGHKFHSGCCPGTAWRRRSFPMRHWIPLTDSFQPFFTPSLCQRVRLCCPLPAFPPLLTPSFCSSSEAFSPHLLHV